MKRSFYIFLLLVLLAAGQTFAQGKADLKPQIEQILSARKATVGVAIVGGDGEDEVVVNGKRRYPMQSVFKFHIGLMMLAEIDKGKLKLDQQVEIKKEQMLPGMWSPLREENPEGGSFPISKLVEYSVSQSDNAACDALLRVLGGPLAVEKYFNKHGIKDIAIRINEKTMQSNWDMMFQNWTTPQAANEVLKKFYENKKKQLSQKGHDFIWRTMRETSTGPKRLRGQLPEGIVVAHKTGYSGAHKTTGVHAAVNDIGIVFLPNGKYFYISVFVTDSKEDFDTNEKIIADIARAAWDHFAAKQR